MTDVFLADILAHPEDDAPRLVFADWLEEHGGGARAEFIRVQVDLARPARCEWEDEDGSPCPQYNARRPSGRLQLWCPACAARGKALPELRRREHNGLAEHWRAWLADFYRITGRDAIGDMDICSDDSGAFAVRFRRGFVEEVALPCAAWEEHGPALVRAAPLTRVRLTDVTPTRMGEGRWAYWHLDLRRMWDGLGHAQGAGAGSRYGWCYASEADAEVALSAACLAWARAATPVRAKLSTRNPRPA